MNFAPSFAESRVAQFRAEAEHRRALKQLAKPRPERPRFSLRALFVRLRLA